MSVNPLDLVGPSLVVWRGAVVGMADSESIMTLAAIIIFIVAIVLAISGGIWAAANWLIWVAIVLAVIAIIMFLLRVISGRRPTA